MQKIKVPNPPLLWELLRRPLLFRLLPKVLVFLVIHPLLLSVVVCRNEPSLFHEDDRVRLIPPDPDFVEWVIRVPLPLLCVVVVRVVDPVFFVRLLYAIVYYRVLPCFWPEKKLVTCRMYHNGHSARALNNPR